MEEYQKRVQTLIDKAVKNEITLSKTSLKMFLKSPKEFIQYKLGEYTPSTSQALGSMAHIVFQFPEHASFAMLQMEKDFQKDFYIWNISDRPEKEKGMTSKLNKAWKSKIHSDNHGKNILDFYTANKEFEKARKLLDHQILKLYLTRATVFEPKEVFSTTVKSEEYKFHYRPDLETYTEFVDFKSGFTDFTPHGLQSVIVRNQYALDLYIYHLYNKKTPILLFLNTETNTAINVDASNWLELGKAMFEKAISYYNYCQQNPRCFEMGPEFWSQFYSDGIMKVDVPQYIKFEYGIE